jgi:hypothetical protein
MTVHFITAVDIALSPFRETLARLASLELVVERLSATVAQHSSGLATHEARLAEHDAALQIEPRRAPDGWVSLKAATATGASETTIRLLCSEEGDSIGAIRVGVQWFVNLEMLKARLPRGHRRAGARFN